MKIEPLREIPSEKERAVVDAAMRLFGAMGYKKTSVADIAAAAGISKAMVFYYFGSKKTLYLYLVAFAGNTLKSEIDRLFDKSVTDFFDRIKLGADIKISVLKKHPSLLTFLTSMYCETDREVVAEIKQIVADGKAYSSAFVITNADKDKFKDNVDPALVLEILVNYTEGYLSKMPLETAEDIDLLMARFGLCLDLMKNNLYKETSL